MEEKEQEKDEVDEKAGPIRYYDTFGENMIPLAIRLPMEYQAMRERLYLQNRQSGASGRTDWHGKGIRRDPNAVKPLAEYQFGPIREFKVPAVKRFGKMIEESFGREIAEYDIERLASGYMVSLLVYTHAGMDTTRAIRVAVPELSLNEATEEDMRRFILGGIESAKRLAEKSMH